MSWLYKRALTFNRGSVSQE